MWRYVVLVIAALISAPLFEVLSMVWLRLLPASADLTGNYVATVAAPVALCLHFMWALALWKLFEPIANRGSVVFVGTHAMAQGALLAVLGNHVGDVIAVTAVVALSGTMVMGAFSRYIWCPHCAYPPV